MQDRIKKKVWMTDEILDLMQKRRNKRGRPQYRETDMEVKNIIKSTKQGMANRTMSRNRRAT